MKKLPCVGVVGGEMHIGHVTSLHDDALRVVKAAVRPALLDSAAKAFSCPVVALDEHFIEDQDLDIIAVAHENDKRCKMIVEALAAGKDVVADKPIALTEDEQARIETALSTHPERKLLQLLTLRGEPVWAGLRELVQRGSLGAVAHMHIRMAVRLKRDARPDWFLDSARSGGLFLDLLIHGLDQVEWITGERITAMTAVTGNLSQPDEPSIRDHAAVFCELSGGGSALVEGQRMLPDTINADYRAMVAGTAGVAELTMAPHTLTLANAEHGPELVAELPPAVSVVKDWLADGTLTPQHDSLRANRLALAATKAAMERRRVVLKDHKD